MDQQALALFDFALFTLYLGSITFILGALYQAYWLRKNRISLLKSILILIITRIITFIASIFIWVLWVFPFDTMFLFILIPALIPELILSPSVVWLFAKPRQKTKNQ